MIKSGPEKARSYYLIGNDSMSRRDEYVSRTEKLVQPFVDEYGLELVDVEYVKEAGEWYLRIYADKEGGITIGDCETISRALSDLLDKEDYISENYILEVSSPGLDRPLKKDKDFARSIGKDVEIRLFKAIDRQKEFVGVLRDYDAQCVTIETDSGDTLTFNRKDISRIRLAFFYE